MGQYETIEDIPKRLRVMKKRLKQSLVLVGILIVSLSLSGCEKFVETDVSAETKSTIQTINETTAPNNQEETAFVTEFEITDWTMENLVNDISLCGKKITLPINPNTLNPEFDLINYYDKWYNETVFILSCNGEDVALMYCDGDCSNSSDILINNIQYGINKPIPQLNIMGITKYSSSDDVKKILGEPNYIQDNGNTFRYIFSDKKQFMISFTDDYDAIDFYHIQYEED